jgi:hypothetical protein
MSQEQLHTELATAKFVKKMQIWHGMSPLVLKWHINWSFPAQACAILLIISHIYTTIYSLITLTQTHSILWNSTQFFLCICFQHNLQVY